MLKIWSRPVGDYEMNTILVWDEQTRKAALFDPGGEARQTMKFAEQQGLDILYLINTHGHVDHITENGVVKSLRNVPLLIHALDQPMLLDPLLNLSAFTGEPVTSPDADRLIAEGDEISIGSELLKLYHVPGHSQGSLVFYQPGLLIAGDTLFNGSVGRTDFPGCSADELYGNIRAKIYTLPDDTEIYPGHGPTTTVGYEKRTNPFVCG
jgi:glyoxylase-like metal-dependent hydrolase (beta-lactamase superfamily II)